MSKFWTKFKNLVFNKTTGFLFFGLSLTSVLTVSLTYKYKNNFKPSFYNFRSYMSEDSIARMQEDFDYKEFDEINQFTNALLTRKAIAGIGNDALAVELIKQNKLAKIDYQTLFNFDEETVQDKNKLANKLKSLYTEQIWEHLISYDEDLKTDNNGKLVAEERHLWEYFVPYFSQDMVVVYNPSKILNKDDFETYYEFDTQILNQLISEKNDDLKWTTRTFSDYDVLRTIKNMGFDNWEITDAVRDNMVYGSSYRLNTETKQREDSQATGDGYDNKNNESIHKELLDQFEELIRDSLDYSLTSKKVNFIGDGLELVDKIIDPNSQINAGIIYNGDVIDAYLSADNHPSVRNGAIRFIRPKTNILLVDGLVISSETNNYYRQKVFEAVKESYLNGLLDDNGNQITNWDETEEKVIETLENNMFVLNFDDTGYIPVYKYAYDFIKEHYFDYQLDEAYENEMKARYQNLNLSNERWNEIFAYEKDYMKSLYDITNEYTLKLPGTNQNLITDSTKISYHVDHLAIKPVNEKTLTDIQFYWGQKIKK
ncbi:hypothetical protein [Mycoplasmopsis gallinarum]|uniref:Putative spermidine/putrescine substrate binding protein n=1 Tax=Mycoplasmopsis gallinarum TaxID=29557 RepID=A0A168RBT5_9BACT|nr:hypothetical protein [Mycoplasmopsis gallinarum]OAB48815.1 putative spermidine/putrescine substrate binding protein [Mycoplasmopsis gallinarum]